LSWLCHFRSGTNCRKRDNRWLVIIKLQQFLLKKVWPKMICNKKKEH
jgi:hypothetical protein